VVAGKVALWQPAADRQYPAPPRPAGDIPLTPFWPSSRPVRCPA